MGSVKKMFDPKTIALIGASEAIGTVGCAMMENLLSSKSKKIFPINPRKKSIMGLECYPDISKISEHIDLGVIAIPAKDVPATVEECGKAGVDGLIIVSAGFREIGEEGNKLEQQLIEIKKRHGIRIVGPNCIGVIRPNIGLNASLLKADPKPGNLAFISQSGALGGAILDWAIKAHIGFSMFASIGSMIDVDFGDLIDFLGDDYQTRNIILYMENIGNAKKFMSAARGFARNKPIIVVKPGSFFESTKASLPHTGPLAGDDQVYDAAFKRVGVIRAKEVSDIFNIAEVLDSKYLPKGRNLAIITNTGGFGVMAADVLINLNGELATLSQNSIEELNSFLPSFWSKCNPVDVLEDADVERYTKAVRVCLNDPQVNGVLAIYAPQPILQADLLADSITGIARYANKPIIAAWIGGEHAQRGRDILLRNNVPTYETPEEAVKTYLYMYKYRRNLDLLYETPSELALDEAPPKYHLKVLVRRAIKEGRVLLSDEESKGFLNNYGIPIIESKTVHDIEGAVSMANKIGYPVSIKIVSSGILHRGNAGGIKVGIKSDEEMKKAFTNLIDSFAGRDTHAKISGISVQKMLDNVDYEMMLGAKKDKNFGSVIFFGMGGIGMEVFKDVSIGLPPLNQTLAKRLMEETAIYKMLQGYRGKISADPKQIEHILVSFSNLIVDFPEIAEMDINPLAVANGKAYAIDARIVIDKNCLEYVGQYPHLVITPYPTKYTMTWRMNDGKEVLLRPIKPEDEPLELAMLSSLSEETMRTRFFSIIKEITHDMLVRFCNIDYNREMAIVAELKQEDRKKIIGIGRLIIESDFNSGEYAVLVHDAYHGKGLGYKLVDVLIGIAQDKGLNEIYGIVLSNNEKMLRVSKKLGFTTKPMPDGISRVELVLK